MRGCVLPDAFLRVNAHALVQKLGSVVAYLASASHFGVLEEVLACGGVRAVDCLTWTLAIILLAPYAEVELVETLQRRQEMRAVLVEVRELA